MIQSQGLEGLYHIQSRLQAEDERGDGQLGWWVQGNARPLQPPTQWLAP